MTPSETPPHGPAHRRSPTPALVVGLVVTLGMERIRRDLDDALERQDAATASILVATWPGWRTEEFASVASGRAYDCVEGKGLSL